MTPRTRAALVPAGIGPSNSGVADLRGVTGNAPLALLGKANQRKDGGRVETIERGAAPRTVIDLSGEDALASVCTITINVDVSQKEDPARMTRAMLPPIVALLSWGTDGGSNNAEVDVLRGQSIQVPASALIVQVAFDVLPGLLVGLPVATFATVSGSVGYYPTGAGPAQRTRYAFLLPAGSPADADEMIVDVPAFARRVRVLRSVASNPLDIVQLGPSGFEIAQQNTLDPNAVMPLSVLATQMRVRNLGAAPVAASLVFELAL